MLRSAVGKTHDYVYVGVAQFSCEAVSLNTVGKKLPKPFFALFYQTIMSHEIAEIHVLCLLEKTSYLISDGFRGGLEVKWSGQRNGLSVIT